MLIGPGATNKEIWSAAYDKYHHRAHNASGSTSSVWSSTISYNLRTVTVLSFVAQFQHMPRGLAEFSSLARVLQFATQCLI